MALVSLAPMVILTAPTNHRWKRDSMLSRFGVVVDRVYLLCSTSAACKAIDWVPQLWRNKTQLVDRTKFDSLADPIALSKANSSHPLTSATRYQLRATVAQKAIVAHAQARKYKHILVLTEKVTPIENPATTPSLPVASLLSRVGAVRLAYNMLKPRRFKNCWSGSCPTLPYSDPRVCRMCWLPHQIIRVATCVVFLRGQGSVCTCILCPRGRMQD